MKIRLLDESELPCASMLARESFLHGTAPLCSPRGVQVFLAYSCSESIRERVLGGSVVAGAFEGDRLVGVLELRPDFHISMLFVAPDRQGRGAGKTLLKWGMERFAGGGGRMLRVTVNSSPNAEGFYRAFGFEALKPEREADGIRFVPMAWPSRRDAGER